MGIPDEFRPAIVDCFPKLITLLTDSDNNARAAGADTLVKLSKAGEQKQRLLYHSTDGHVDKFGPAIVDCFPKLVILLTDSDGYVRGAGANALAELSENGKQK
jgi:HEAT repeat protein